MVIDNYQPIIISTTQKVKDILTAKPYITYVDAFQRQLKELFFIENHDFFGEEKEKIFQSTSFKNFTEEESKRYCYIFYPWNYTIIKCIEKDKYLKLKTNRNQDLITSSEQKILSKYKIAVLGMSVGSNISLILTQAGISNDIILADFDSLDTTNLNRIVGGIHQIGLNKCIINARKIYEDNPFAKVKILTSGVNKHNLSSLLKQKKIDLIVEEIDNLAEKIEIRKLALQHKIPVIMITDNGDGIVLTVERYDLGYNSFFQKNITYWKNKLSGSFTPQKAADIIINDFVGGKDYVDPKMLKSVQKVYHKELVSWSQLGSAALLGAVAATIAIKKIALGEDKRKYRQIHINLPI